MENDGIADKSDLGNANILPEAIEAVDMLEKNSELEEEKSINPDQDMQEGQQIDTSAKSGYVESRNPDKEFGIEDKEYRSVEEKTVYVDVNSVSFSSEDSTVEKDVQIQPTSLHSENSDSSFIKSAVEDKEVNQIQIIGNRINKGKAEESDETRKKLLEMRVKFLRVARRLGQTPQSFFVEQVMYELRLDEKLWRKNGSRVSASYIDPAIAMAEQLEADGQEPLDFTCTIMVIGKTGVGKSATINSIFDEKKVSTDAFQLGTKKVQDVVGTVQGIRVRFIDTPGLLSSCSYQRQNVKILKSVKRFIKNSPPDIVLYFDRLDVQTRGFDDMPLLRTITEVFGVEIWKKTIVSLTHAASAPPRDGPDGTATDYVRFVDRRSLAVQQVIRQTAGDVWLMNPVSLVENHSACRRNRAGQRVLPNGLVWKPHLLLESFTSKIISEARTLLELYDTPGKPRPRSRPPRLPILLSSLLQSIPQLKSPQDQLLGDDEDDGSSSDSDSDKESEYEALPPFRRLTRAEISELSKSQKKVYYDELEYRDRLFKRKLLKEEKRRRKMMKKRAAEVKVNEASEEQAAGLNIVLPQSFDSDDLIHRYPNIYSNQYRVGPILYTEGWDHDIGFDSIYAERLFALNDNIPASFFCQVTKEKRYGDLKVKLASSLKHGKKKSTTVVFDVHAHTPKYATYTLRSETLFSNHRRNKATAGVSVTKEGGSWTAGMKAEDRLTAGRWAQLAVLGGTVFTRGDAAYGGSIEATLRDNEDPNGRFLTDFGASVMSWNGDLAIGWNAQTQIPVTRSTNLTGRLNMNNMGNGKFGIMLNCSEPLQIAAVALAPLLMKLCAYFQLRMQQN